MRKVSLFRVGRKSDTKLKIIEDFISTAVLFTSKLKHGSSSKLMLISHL